MNTYYYPFMWLFVAAMAVAIFAVSSSIGMYWSRIQSDPKAQGIIGTQLRNLRRLRLGLQVIALLMVAGGIGSWFWEKHQENAAYAASLEQLKAAYSKDVVWQSPDWSTAEKSPKAKLIAYGRDLIVNTNDYFGDNGLVRPHSINSLNCQNCHLDAGTKTFGNNYSGVAGNYPKIRARSGRMESIPNRINDCFMRSLNGQAIDSTSHEMEAMVAYMQWLGLAVPKGEKPKGVGLVDLPFLDRAADPVNGQKVYEAKCASCHGSDGQGLPRPGTERNYPPLWGPQSYNEAAGLFRLSRLASYVKANMPFGATYDNPQLSDEEAWDVGAYINSQPRPKHPFLKEDWPDVSKKPFDHPFGPYKDDFPEAQHKLGPFKPIVAFYKK